ncbi:exported hypothetical protein [Candidatus Nitrosotenuis uzonensis]|uniref:Uncharacterized protein n=2 Tax=Candidatus Nitrosotenuis uzonensis TaxID=1407055 RepID=V6AVF1_9ARCH|nr:exported hypothetical protein [Candidatus Nitrosotenuis uzonensis]
MLEVLFLALVLFAAMADDSFEAIPITYSGTMEDVHFDGKWSFETEWKQSSLNTYNYPDEHQAVLRTAHQGDFVYMFIDMLTDFTLDKGKDKAVVCFDSNNDKTQFLDRDDYCIVAILDSNSTVFQGDLEQIFVEISRPEGLESISTVSDENDRYSSIPHPGYEFKIPTSLIGRSNEYGFYFAVYDENSQKLFTYPPNVTEFTPQNPMVPVPAQWGTIYSPDKSLPEFHLPFLALLASVSVIILLSRTGLFNHT